MDADRFDALVRSLRFVAPRRAALSVVGAGLAVLLAHLGSSDSQAGKGKKNKRRRRRRKKCRGGKKKCGKKCIPKSHCCKSANCGVNEKCAGGACVPCLGQGTTCTDDSQCCTGICDTYTNACQQVRVSCAAGEPCPNGRCCDVFSPQCLYEKATQGACVPGGEPNASCGYVLCGDRCSDLTGDSDHYCGYYGSAACRNGRCCCPRGIPLADCANLDGVGQLPRCKD